jgi:hypothetical protein
MHVKLHKSQNLANCLIDYCFTPSLVGRELQPTYYLGIHIAKISVLVQGG